MTSDPIGLDGGINTFIYTHNNPLKYIDPDGLEVRFICRTLAPPWDKISARIYGKPQKHCFVYVSCKQENWSYIISLFASDKDTLHGVPTRAQKSASTPYDLNLRDDLNDPAIKDNIDLTPKCGNSNCEYEKEVMERFFDFPSEPVPYFPNLLNSNSFARSMVRSPERGIDVTNVQNAPGIEFGGL
jgi:hypothetical protein